METTIWTKNSVYVLNSDGFVTAVTDRKTDAAVPAHRTVGGRLLASITPPHGLHLRTPRVGEHMLIGIGLGREVRTSAVEEVDGPSLDLRSRTAA